MSTVQNELHAYRSRFAYPCCAFCLRRIRYSRVMGWSASEAEGSYGHTAFLYLQPPPSAPSPSPVGGAPRSSLPACAKTSRQGATSDMRRERDVAAVSWAETKETQASGMCCLGGLVVLDQLDVGSIASQAAHDYVVAAWPGVLIESQLPAAREGTGADGSNLNASVLFDGRADPSRTNNGSWVEEEEGTGANSRNTESRSRLVNDAELTWRLRQRRHNGAERRFADRNDENEAEKIQAWSTEVGGLGDLHACQGSHSVHSSGGGQGAKEEQDSCRVDVVWNVSRRVLTASSAVGSGDEEWRGGEGNGAWRRCDVGLCDDGEAIIFQTDLAMISERHGEAGSIAAGKAEIGSRPLPCPVTISFFLDVPKRSSGEGYVILRRELDYALPDQCARIYVAGKYAATWMTAG